MVAVETLVLQRMEHDEDGRMWSVYCEGEVVGSIIQPFTGHRWQWSITVQDPAPISKSGRAETREAAMADFRAAWDRYREHIGERGWQDHLQHMAELRARPWYVAMMLKRDGTDRGK
ncbi:hypothetical protein [Bosea vaviloviae]|uniref:Uncharacterized protein n=1 Tax=Bosea vaviloviae TaxID=1526658 RepID=A0A1D7U040_9HYPH|nr:hypothetical protein [Bosea vaviloviae]AOO80739.1 hypothetical protein BHK69_09910 [Bosea vaviloviae]